MKNKNTVIIGAVAIVTGAIIVNCKRFKQWFKEDYHRHKMELGCKCCTKEVEICPKCYYCLECKPEHLCN